MMGIDEAGAGSSGSVTCHFFKYDFDKHVGKSCIPKCGKLFFKFNFAHLI